MTEPYEFTDGAGDVLTVAPAAECPATACIRSEGTYVQAHKLAGVVAAMYEAAGQPVPDLPVIHDEAEVARLTRELGAALSRADRSAAGGMPMRVREEMARDLLDHGVRLPEAK